MAAVDNTLEDRRNVVLHLRALAKLETMPCEVAHFLTMAAGVARAVESHTASQAEGAGSVVDRQDVERRFEALPLPLRQALCRVGEVVSNASDGERATIGTVFGRLADEPGVPSAIAQVAAGIKDASAAPSSSVGSPEAGDPK